MRISGSIVIYNENENNIKRLIESFLKLSFEKKLIIIDNSPKDKLKKICEGFKEVKYIFSGKNLGFGKGHNLAFKNISNSNIHMIINPDIYFEPKEIDKFLNWLNESKNIVLATTKVYDLDGSIQNIVRNIPTPLTLIKRRFNPFGVFNKFIEKDEFSNIIFEDIIDIPFAHGSFMIFKTDIFTKLNGFDERFFMYMEDVDIFIRSKKYGRTVLNPNFKIYHEYRKGSSKNIKLLIWHTISAIKFFIKYKKYILGRFKNNEIKNKK